MTAKTWSNVACFKEHPFLCCRHSATLMSDKLIIFGGRTTATYLNDLHVLDLGKINLCCRRQCCADHRLILSFLLIWEGFMEYTSAKCGNMPPLPRGWVRASGQPEDISLLSWRQNNLLGFVSMTRFHAALPVSGNRILVCGGCSAIGALQDVHIVNIGESVTQTA